MPFFDKLTSLAQNAMDKTNEMLDMNKLNSSIGTERAKIAELKMKLGEYCWARYASGAAVDEEPAGLCAEIKTREDTIASIQAEIQAKKDEAQKAAQAAQAAVQPQAGTSVCPACGAVNPASSKFCKDCGGKLEPPPAVKLKCAACGIENPPGTKFCTNCGAGLEEPAVPIICECGAENPPGTKFCGACGKKLAS